MMEEWSCECCCDSQEQHEAAREESLREFLRSPGPPPKDWDATTVERVGRTVEEERKKRGL